MDREEYPDSVDTGACSAPWTATATMEASTSPEACPLIPDDKQVDAVQAAPVENAGPTPAQVIEALLFASDAPLSPARLSELAEIGSVREVRKLIAALNEKYEAAGLSFRIEEIARGYQLLTQPPYQPWLARLNQHRDQTRLTPAALETLSIVAYKQPVIRADVEAIRGVSCGEVLNRLREMGLVKIIGRAEIVGRPLLYGTTRKFLDTFGLADLDDLPPVEALAVKKAARIEDVPQDPTQGLEAPERRVAAAGA